MTPDDAQNLQLLLQEKDYAALVTATEGWQQEPSGIQAKFHALGLLGSGDHHASLAPFQFATQKLAQDQVVHFAHANALAKNNQLEQAKAAYETVLTLNPNHPAAPQAIQLLCATLAERDEPNDPMAAVTWLYRAWELKREDPNLAAKVLDVYVKNGWAPGANDFVAMLDPNLQNHPKIRQLRQKLPKPQAAPKAPLDPTYENCPFCHQQVIFGATTCPHCKLQIRASAFNGKSGGQDWQTTALTVLCIIMILLNVTNLILVFASGQTSSKGAVLGQTSLSLLFNVLILFRVDWVMAIARVWYILSACLTGCCGAFSLSLVGFGRAELLLVPIILLAGCGLNAFLAYLVGYEADI